ncbi:hypothetical protein DSL92_05090 [Billgrantia gudaonensis]|uniref:Uncharacterized protein n=1 Tax=Billgrantia gudaonensis TaxID=376427 RepID=A0A3S0Q178_9GAMM|nr:hypothetical protein DSL92_05090 [Halomonas gudaonensis]
MARPYHPGADVPLIGALILLYADLLGPVAFSTRPAGGDLRGRDRGAVFRLLAVSLALGHEKAAP